MAKGNKLFTHLVFNSANCRKDVIQMITPPSVPEVGKTVLEKISILQTNGRVLSLEQKILLAEMGTVEQVLNILLDSEIEVRVITQVERERLITRESILLSKKTGRSLIRARSSVFCENLSENIVQEIRKREKGIGVIISTARLDTFREIVEMGWNLDSNFPYRIYRIIHAKNVAFEIKEEILI